MRVCRVYASYPAHAMKQDTYKLESKERIGTLIMQKHFEPDHKAVIEMKVRLKRSETNI